MLLIVIINNMLDEMSEYSVIYKILLVQWSSVNENDRMI